MCESVRDRLLSGVWRLCWTFKADMHKYRVMESENIPKRKRVIFISHFYQPFTIVAASYVGLGVKGTYSRTFFVELVYFAYHWVVDGKEYVPCLQNKLFAWWEGLLLYVLKFFVRESVVFPASVPTSNSRLQPMYTSRLIPWRVLVTVFTTGTYTS